VSDSLGRVLVVDDNEAVRRLITVNLELEGFEVTTAVDGQDCLAKVREVRPHAVTLDVVMPRLDGIRTAARLRDDPQTRGIKIVMVTATVRGPDRARAEEIGVDAYLTKPFDPATLVATMRRVLGLPPS
jgi:CheY-like chemotaxis protein